MKVLATGAFQVTDGEEITIDVKATGTLFGVNFSLSGIGSPLTKGQPLKVTFDKSQATRKSKIPNAKAAKLTLLFSFSGNNGGRYDLTVAGSGNESFPDFVQQAGNTPMSVDYVFHIV